MDFLRNLLGGKQPEGNEDIEKLVQDLQSGDVNVGVNAAKALGKSRNPHTVEPLITALEDEKYVSHGNVAVSPVAEAAEESLVQLGAIAMEPLIPHLKRNEKPKDWLVRLRVARALGRIGDPHATEPLIALLEDPEYPVRAEAIRALTRIGKSAKEQLMAASKQESALTRIGACEALAVIGEPAALAPLIANLKTGGDLSVRKQSARALGNIGNPQAIDALIESLQDNDEHLRGYAMTSLVKIGPKSQGRVVLLLVSEDRQTRNNASDALSISVRFGELKTDARATKIVGTAIKERWARRQEVMSLLFILKELGDARAAQFAAATQRGDESTIRQIINSF